ncbi:hypothetical protein NQ317_015462 [Molorchus minor]|uniref:Ig-like domain-containing protein n=1 Tax=Molorchus minor TaxID=1323400 RepID=A0ABQ9JTH9_9CUCU|nr:hypothetical protein NQ317_015462 [Molorchus minor]
MYDGGTYENFANYFERPAVCTVNHAWIKRGLKELEPWAPQFRGGPAGVLPFAKRALDVGAYAGKGRALPSEALGAPLRENLNKSHLNHFVGIEYHPEEVALQENPTSSSSAIGTIPLSLPFSNRKSVHLFASQSVPHPSISIFKTSIVCVTEDRTEKGNKEDERGGTCIKSFTTVTVITDVFDHCHTISLPGVFKCVTGTREKVQRKDSTHNHRQWRSLRTSKDTTLTEKLILECDYCKETDDYRPKNWYKIDSLGMSRPQVVLGMENDMELNRIQVNTAQPHHQQLPPRTRGLYYCVGFEKQEKEEKYNYLVDLVYEVNTTDFETGNISGWSKYHDDYFAPVNGMFRSQGSRIRTYKGTLKARFRSDKPVGSLGHMRAPKLEREENNWHYHITMGLKLGVQERCEGHLQPGRGGHQQRLESRQEQRFQIPEDVRVVGGAHLTLVCPESSLENTVTWKNRGKALTPGEAANPNLLVDTFNTLPRRRHRNPSDLALLTREFVRHLAYLGFVLSLTGTCYCAGLVVTYNRRRTFKTFEELIEDHPEDADDYEHLLKK